MVGGISGLGSRLSTMRSQQMGRVGTTVQQKQKLEQVKTKAAVKTSFFSKTQKHSVKTTVDIDARIANIDAKMQAKGMDPPKMESRLGIFAKVVGKMIAKIPVGLANVVKGIGKLGAYTLQLATHTVGLIVTGPKALYAAYKAAPGQGWEAAKQSFSEDNAAIHKAFSGVRDSMENATKSFDNWYSEKLGLTEPGKEATTDGVDQMVSTVDEVAGYLGTNVLEKAGDVSKQAEDTSKWSTGDDGDAALFVGGATALASLGNAGHDIETAIGELKALKKELKAMQADPLSTPEDIAFKKQEVETKESEVKAQITSSGLELLSGVNTAINLVVGSDLTSMGATDAWGNVTDAAGFGLAAASKAIEATVETLQANNADKKVQRCNAFLSETATVDGDGNEVVATRGTQKVRDAVRAFKRNNQETRGVNRFSGIAKYAMSAASIVGGVLFIAAMATNPIGWAVGGVAIAVGIGTALYKGYKADVRASQTQALKDRQTQVTEHLTDGVKNLAGELGIQESSLPTGTDGKLKLGSSLRELESKIKDDLDDADLDLRSQALTLDRGVGGLPILQLKAGHPNPRLATRAVSEVSLALASVKTLQQDPNASPEDLAAAAQTLKSKLSTAKQILSPKLPRHTQQFDDLMAVCDRMTHSADTLGVTLDRQATLTDLKEVQSLRKQIGSAIMESEGASAMEGLIKALNNSNDEAGQEAAAVALKDVFKMEPKLFMTDTAGTPTHVSSEVHEKAKEVLAEKLSQFQASVSDK